MCICDNLFNNDEKQKKRDLGFFAFLDDWEKREKYDQEIVELKDWQKELVKNGEYDSTSFEEDLEGDDYYSEDE